MTLILGIETSCDDTGIAIFDKHKGLLSNKLNHQKLHAKYGGIVPELAAREHTRMVIPLIQRCLQETKLSIKDIHGISYTAGPGLIGSLMVGSVIGNTLSYICKVPAIPIHHMEGHLLSPMLKTPSLSFPLVALLISGGHTQLIFAKKIGKYKILGETVDDAIGEAFDKTAKLLDLPYPGGKSLSLLAKKGIPKQYIFPLPMTKKKGLEFSFSGLKTFAANVIRNSKKNKQTKANIALAFENAIVETLIIKCHRALNLTKCNNLLISGGVSANQKIRTKLKNMIKKRKGKIFITPTKFCTDNGAMIAYAGILRLNNHKKTNLEILVQPNWSIEDLLPIN
ncbi:tRNA N6-adenosine threonylcarbamoyltransferase [Candidatus Westeberhardia cardiocondylae]|uniref:tRNA N6-adenosine threonylcarbamoyltransferase n=1 Tax=Candidatus Westeberhardia cardiocondylae TaxID=1594731 RepID=A0A0H5BWP5_9ENTR|nr:tRNA (adenosine(37)-N6)-threonylcarbamoyltransferase complex transferase subunit TsaD [Candidatus Westeberhardia cardiocondylae]CEN32034.1 tRNA N6-adenosine threonylcarbamoyltransferase [Candidatus Westeberhardia cardiocondylae]